jgi:hypothetical protein
MMAPAPGHDVVLDFGSWSMIRKSGYRFSEKICSSKKIEG